MGKKVTVFIAQLKANLNSNDMVHIYEIKTTNRQTLCSSPTAKIKEHVQVMCVCACCVFRELAGPSWRGGSTGWYADGLWLAQILAGVLKSTHTSSWPSQTPPMKISFKYLLNTVTI